MGIIYVLKNEINGKIYVGQTTKNIEYRIKIHMLSKYLLGKALRKYGIENFKKFFFEIPDVLLDYFEIQMIKNLNCLCPNGYNLDKGGHKNKQRSDKTKEKISKTRKGFKFSEEHKKNISKAMTGRHPSDETKRKLSEANKGRKISEEHKKKLIESHHDLSGINHPMYGKKHSEETKEKMSNAKKKMIMNINTGQIFNSLLDAANFTKINISGISLCCKGKRKTAGKYRWKYYIQ